MINRLHSAVDMLLLRCSLKFELFANKVLYNKPLAFTEKIKVLSTACHIQSAA